MSSIEQQSTKSVSAMNKFSLLYSLFATQAHSVFAEQTPVYQFPSLPKVVDSSTMKPTVSPTIEESGRPSSIPSKIPSSSPSIAESEGPSVTMSAVPTEFNCQNNDSYRNESNDFWSCKWIEYKLDRRLKFCKKSGVKENCPLSCGECCEDDINYTFTAKSKTVGCDWLLTDESLQIEHRLLHEEDDLDEAPNFCSRFRNGKMVRDGCPKSCNFCKPKAITEVPTSNPTTAATNQNIAMSPEPSASITTTDLTDHDHECKNDNLYLYDGKSCRWIRRNDDRRAEYCQVDEVMESCPVSCGQCCEDDDHYTFTIGAKTKGCDWLTAPRADEYCDQWKNGRMVWDGCPKSCDFCKVPVTGRRLNKVAQSAYEVSGTIIS